MELQYNIIIAVWLTTWAMVQIRVFMPSMIILGKMDNSNPSYRWWPFAWILFGIMSFITVPVMLFPCLSDKYRDIFVKVYVNNLLKIEL